MKNADSHIIRFVEPHGLKVGDIVLIAEGREALIFENPSEVTISVSEELKNSFVGQFHGRLFLLTELPTNTSEPPLEWLNLKRL